VIISPTPLIVVYCEVETAVLCVI